MADIFTPQRIILVLGIAAIALVSLFGGWGAAEDAADDTPAVKANESFSAQPFEVTVTRARAFHELPGAFPSEEGYRYLALVADVTNTSAEPVLAVTLGEAIVLGAAGLRTIELSSGPQPIKPQVVRTLDSLNQRAFQPGLTSNVILLWQQSTAEDTPDEASVTFSEHSWRRSSLDDSFGWRDPAPTAVLTIEVEPIEAQ